MKKIFFYALSAVFFYSCVMPEKKNKDLSFKVKGSFKECAGDTVFLKHVKEDGLEFIDSALVSKDGGFEIKGRISSKDFYVLHFNNPEKAITIIPDTCEDIVIKSDDKNYDKHYTVENSPESEKVCQIIAELTKMQEVTDTLGRTFRRSVSDKHLAEIKRALTVVPEWVKKHRRKMEKLGIDIMVDYYMQREFNMSMRVKTDEGDMDISIHTDSPGDPNRSWNMSSTKVIEEMDSPFSF